MNETYTEEDYLHETLAMLQESYTKAAKPYLDRLIVIHAMKKAEPMFVSLAGCREKCSCWRCKGWLTVDKRV